MENHAKKKVFYQETQYQTAVFMIVSILFVSLSAFAKGQDRILFISSYHPGFPTFFQQVEGLSSVFQGKDIFFDIEFMDTKRFPEKSNWDIFRTSLTYKLERVAPYDVIVVADDNALQFALEEQTGLFKGKPIVFLGVNNIDLALELDVAPQITGVIEAVSMKETIELMMRLQPYAVRIVALVDNTPSGQGDLKRFYQIAKEFDTYEFSDISISKMAWPEFSNALEGLGPNTAVLLISAYKDKYNKTLLFHESLRRIKDRFSGPLFHLWYHGLGDGVLGGKIISHHEQGREAARIVLRILKGEPVHHIRVVNESPNQYVFDYNELKKNNLKMALLPDPHVILNEPYSFYRENKPLFWSVTALFLVLCLSLFFAVLNIFQRKQVEMELRQSEDELRAVFEAAEKVAFIITDTRGTETTILEFSPGAEKIFGYTKAEILGHPVSILHLPEDVERFPLVQQKMREGKTGFSGESVLVRKSGEKFPALFSTYPLLDESGEMVAVLGVGLDVNEQKDLESQLRQSHKMESVGTLAGGIAHDFNNILGIILGNAELGIDNIPQQEKARHNFEEIRIASLRAKELIRQLLSFARKAPLKKAPGKIIPIVTESLRLLRSSLPSSIEIRQNIPEKIDTILADLTQMNQVLLNLCTNAAHSMPDGGIIEVTLENTLLSETRAAMHPDLNPGPYVTLIVSDTGHGISREDMDRLFDPYFTTKELGKGTGMGLAVVHGIVKEHNGTIMVKSEPGKGTQFSVFFPVLEVEITREIKTDEKRFSGNETLLFVDDETAIAEMTGKMLEQLGYRVETRTDPADALALFTSAPHKFDLVISDMTMPKMTGLKLSEKLKKIRSDIPVLICTGYSSEIDEEKIKKFRIAACVMKPISMDELARTIREILGQGI